MFNKQNNEKIKIAILEISDQNKAILEFYFSSAGKSLYKEVSEAEATAYITDYDYPGAKEHWEEVSKTTNKPGLILSISEKQVPSTVWLAKPLTAKAITEAAAKIREMINADSLEETADSEAQEISNAIQQSELINESFSEAFEESANEEIISENTAEQVTEDAFTKITVTEQEESKEQEFEAELAMAGAELTTVLSADIEDIHIEEPSDIVLKQNEPEQNEDIIEHEAVDANNDTDEQVLISIEASEETNETQEPSDSTDNAEIDALLESLILGEGNKKQSAISDTLEEVSLEEKAETETHEVSGENKEIDFAGEETELDIEGSIVVEDSLIAEDSVRVEDDLAAAENSFADEITEVGHSDSPKDTDQDALTTDLKDDTKSGLLDFDLEPSIPDELETEKKSLFKDDASTFKMMDNRGIEESNLDQLISDIDISAEETELLDNAFEEQLDADSVNNSENQLDNKADLDLGLDTFDTSPLIEETSKQTAEQELQSLLNEIRTEADKVSPGKKRSSSKFTYGENSSNSENDQISAHEQTNAEKRWYLLCGDNEDIQKTQDAKKIAFTLNKHMLAVLLDQLDQLKGSKQVFRLKHDDMIIVIDSSTDTIYCNYSILSEEYSDYCFQTLNPENIKIHELDYSEIRMYRKKMDDESENAHSIESFVWTTSLLTSRGRLLEHTNISKKIGLKAWPNLTRLELIPHAMNIAAVFSKHPGSLEDIPNWLNIPQRYVFAFYNAALSLDMIELDNSKFKTSTFTFDTDNNSEKNAKERGFFGRLLKRLTA